MRNKGFDKLLKEAIIQEAEEQGARMEPCAEPIPETAQARFDAALNGSRSRTGLRCAAEKFNGPYRYSANRDLLHGLCPQRKRREINV